MINIQQLTMPIFLAPMAGGFNTPELVAAVANAGGVGSFGFAYSSPEAIDHALGTASALTNGPINANFFVFPKVSAPQPERLEAALQALNALSVDQHWDESALTPPYAPDLSRQLEPVWRQRPAILTFHFGIPPLAFIERAHALGISVGITATCVTEARAIQTAGADFIVAQGWEAGGHRGRFQETSVDEELTLLPLVKALGEVVALPVVAAGGLMTGMDIASVLSAGASAAQLGSAFLCCPEANASASHRALLLGKEPRDTAFTRAFSGRSARGIQNQFIEAMDGKELLEFPLQNSLTGALRQWAAQHDEAEFQSVWAGTGYRDIRPLPAVQLIQLLYEELNAVQG